MSTAPACSLGIDIGGTFTDIVIHDHTAGRSLSRKVLTTHDDPSRAVIEGIISLIGGAEGREPSVFGRVVHATTLFTNALIERRGAMAGLITTAGFADTLEIGRERKFELYDIAIRKPEALVRRDRRREVNERIRADGTVMTPLDEAGLLYEATRLLADGVESIALVFLHAYANSIHERRALEILAEKFPELSVTASHEVAPEIREYERASTTCANAFIKPLAESYLDALAERVADIGIGAPLHLMISSGGLTHVGEAKKVPVRMLESGPAAGALAAAHFGRDDANGNLLAFDMGGTTAKLSLIEGGEPMIAHGFEAARQKRFVEGSGLPIRISTVELIEIGAGGGSIARVDDLGFLKVGPASAGSEPGPAAYGLGGTHPTVTDADFMLGYLNPDYFADGLLTVDMAMAEAAMARLAVSAGMDVTATAWGIHDIVNENMAGAARVHIAERGRDPRGFALFSTGGAGPVHADQVARKLGITRLICPPAAGVASALGLLVAPARVDLVATVGVRLDDCDLTALEATFMDLHHQARNVIAETGLDPATIIHQRSADGRFVGQGFDLTVELPPGPYDASEETMRAALLYAFKVGYRKKFARTPPNVAVEFINVRVAARTPVPGGAIDAVRNMPATGQAVKNRRQAYFPDSNGFTETTVYDRSNLPVDSVFVGPAIVEEAGSTLIIGPDASWSVTRSGNIVVTLDGEEEE